MQVLNSSHVSRHNREESFRCFVYQQRHNGYLLSQSAGANCNLYTATEGYRTMTLTKCEILLIFLLSCCLAADLRLMLLLLSHCC